MTGRPSRRAAILLLMIAGITVLHATFPTGNHADHVLHVIFRGLYLVPILAAALWFELPGAAIATVTVIAAYTLHIAVQWSGRPWENANQFGMLAVYAILGGSAGLLARREARLREQKAREAARLQREIVLKSLAGLSQALKWRDTPTQHHSMEVGRLAARMADILGLPPDRIELVRLAGTVHDIGKLGVADDVLLKPGSLSPEERRALEAHPDVAADILKSIPGTDQIAEIVRSHHEALDGSGYPRGLKGNQIPIETRIVTVADVYSALTEERSYKDRMTRRSALDLMRSMTDGALDPRIVDALEAVTAGADRTKSAHLPA